jgi:hypothetical protein
MTSIYLGILSEFISSAPFIITLKSYYVFEQGVEVRPPDSPPPYVGMYLG